MQEKKNATKGEAKVLTRDLFQVLGKEVVFFHLISHGDGFEKYEVNEGLR